MNINSEELCLEAQADIKNIDKSWVYGRYGLAEELKLNFGEAVY